MQYSHFRISKLVLIGSVAGAAGFTIPASATTISSFICPASIPETSIQLDPVPAGWTAYIASPLYLNSAEPTDGPPQLKGELLPTAERKAKEQTTFIYQLQGPFPDGKWLQCSYGEYGQVALARRLDDSIGRCEVSYKKGGKAGQNEIGIDCR